MKKQIALLAILATSLSVFADPIQLQPAPTPVAVPTMVRLNPVTLTADQATTLLTAIAGTNLLTMPTGMTMLNLRIVQMQPITTGSMAGGLRLNIMAAPVTTGT